MHFFRNGHGRKVCQPRSPESTFYHLRNRIIREATAKSNDGRIDQSDFLNHAASSSRYSLFTPMEASIIFHFAGRGVTSQKLALLEFAQLLDPRWRAPHDEFDDSKTTAKTSFLQSFLHSSYNFVQGGEWASVFTRRFKSRNCNRSCGSFWCHHRIPNRHGWVINLLHHQQLFKTLALVKVRNTPSQNCRDPSFSAHASSCRLGV